MSDSILSDHEKIKIALSTANEIAPLFSSLDKLGARIDELIAERDAARKALEIAETCLKEMANEDYRGNRSQHSINAFHALVEINKLKGVQ